MYWNYFLLLNWEFSYLKMLILFNNTIHMKEVLIVKDVSSSSSFMEINPNIPPEITPNPNPIPEISPQPQKIPEVSPKVVPEIPDKQHN